MRIAVLRALPGLGDLLCAVPALRSLRAAHPDAEVSLVGLPSAAWFVERFPHLVDELLALPGWPGLPEQEGADPRAVVRFLGEAQGRGYDLVVQAHGDGRSTNGLAHLLGGARTVVHAGPGCWSAPGAVALAWPEGRSEVERLVDAVMAAGGVPAGLHLELPATASDAAEVAGLLPPGPFVAVHPGSSTALRRWPPACFVAVARELAAAGLGVVVTGGPGEVDVTAEVAAAVAGAVDLGGRTSVGGLGEVLRRSRLLVVGDTGASHLAAATGTPSVVVFAHEGADPARWAPLDAGRHRRVLAAGDHAGAVPVVLAHADQLLGA